MITNKFSYALSLLILFTTICQDIRAQINMTIDAAALDANLVSAAPFPIVSTNSPYFAISKNVTPVITMTLPSASLTDLTTANAFSTSLIGSAEVYYIPPDKTPKGYTLGTFVPGKAKTLIAIFGWGIPTKNLSTDDPILYPQLRIPDLKKSAWKQGIYQTIFKLEDYRVSAFDYSSPGQGRVTPSDGTLTVTVSSLLKIIPPAITPLNLNINDLSYFRKGYQSINTNEKTVIGLQHTVPFSINLPSPLLTYNGVNQASQAKTFTCTFDLKTDVVNGNVISGTTGKSFNITDIPVGNKTTISIAYGLSADILKQNFLRSGTYESPNGNTMTVNEIMSDASQGITNDLAIPEFKVTVSDLKELIIKDKEVNLEFKTAADYINGVKVTMPAHLRTSSTNPFKLTVKAESATFLLNGASSQLPCSLLQLESPEGKSDIQRLSLSTTDQTLLSDAVPVIDRDIDVTYHIPPNPLLVPAPKGIYTLKLTYTMETL